MAKGDPGGMGQSGGNAYGGFFRPNSTSQMGGSFGSGIGGNSGMGMHQSGQMGGSFGGGMGGGPFSAIGQMAGQAGMGMGGGQQQPMNRTGIGPSMRPGGGGFSETGSAKPMGGSLGAATAYPPNPMDAQMQSNPQLANFLGMNNPGAISQIGQLAGQAGMSSPGQMGTMGSGQPQQYTGNYGMSPMAGAMGIMPQQAAGPSDDMIQRLLGQAGMQKQGV